MNVDFYKIFCLESKKQYLCGIKHKYYIPVKTITAYIIALLLCLGTGAGISYGGAVDAETAVETTVKVDAGNIIVDNPTEQPVEVLVYSITGSQVRSAKVAAGDRLYIDVPSGIYIVKAGTSTKRVAVKH